MSADQKVYSAKCKGCGEEIKFVDQGSATYQTSPTIFAVYEAFDPEFPGRIRCGKCGVTSSYEAVDVLQESATE